MNSEAGASISQSVASRVEGRAGGVANATFKKELTLLMTSSLPVGDSRWPRSLSDTLVPSRKTESKYQVDS